MIVQPVNEVLPRVADKELQKILDEFSRTIDEAVNFGTHLLLWDAETKREGKDNNIPTLFFRNIIEIADSISILIKHSSIDPATILFRSFLENNYSLLYMIDEKEKQRALAFMVWRAIKDLKYYNQFISNNQTSKELKAKIKKDNLNLNIEQFFDRQDIKDVIDAKNVLLNKPEFKPIHKEYLRTCEKLNTKNPKWYSLFNGPRNFEGLASHLSKTTVYEFQYRKYSENVHITGIQKGFAKAGNDSAQIIQIRDFEHSKDVFSLTVSYILECFTEYTKKRIPNKMNDMKIWYNKFRNPYYKLISDVNIDYQK